MPAFEPLREARGLEERAESELQPDAQLDYAASRSREDAAEVARGERGVGIVQIGVIEEIEGLSAQLKELLFGELNLFQ